MDEKQKDATPAPADVSAAAPAPADEPVTPPVKTDESTVDLDKLLDIDFSPVWARKTPGSDTGRFREESPHSRNRSDARHNAGGDRGGARQNRPRFDRLQRRSDRSSDQNREYAPPREPEQPLDVNIQLLPSHDQLAIVSRHVRSAQRAYPVFDLAIRLLAKNAAFHIKVEKKDKTTSFFQCRTCKMISLDRQTIATHIVRTHMDEMFIKEEIQGQPPAGNFPCIARCGLTGILLGPTNHHSFNETIRQIHSQRFPDMPLEAYKKKIETLRDPAIIEQWKQESSKQTVYRLKNDTAEKPAAYRWAEAETLFTRVHLQKLIQETRRAIIPAAMLTGMEDSRLRSAAELIWRREAQQPRAFLFVLRAALNGMKLIMFRLPGAGDVVSCVDPAAFTSENLVPAIRDIVDYLKAHPGTRRLDLIKALKPDLPPDSKDVLELGSLLNWLVEKGHLVELFTSAMYLPPQQHAPASR
jgi:hypothetical protein